MEYGSNVTIQNQQGERPSQSAERQGHTTCARYLVVVETCMSLASQVVKLTKQLNEWVPLSLYIYFLTIFMVSRHFKLCLRPVAHLLCFLWEAESHTGEDALPLLMSVCFLSRRQAAERMTLQKQLQRLMDPGKAEGTPSRSPRWHTGAPLCELFASCVTVEEDTRQY